LSPDGASVYVAGGAADGVGVFARDALTGALTFVEAERYGGSSHGVDRPNSLVVTSDGASLYVAGHDDDGVAAFARDPLTGGLTFVEIEDNHGAMSGLKGSFGVTAAPDGRYVFAVGENDHTVSTLRRDAVTSSLTFVEAARDGRLGVDGLRRASAVVVSPDGAHAYVAGHDDDAVAAFAVDRCGNGVLGADEQCDDGNLAAGDGCSSTCRLEFCAAAPASGCRTPTVAGAASLAIVRKGADERHALSWRWSKGEATALTDFGMPTTTDAYLLCVYDGSAAPQPLLSLAAPPDDDCVGVPCWEATNSGFLYQDASARGWRTARPVSSSAATERTSPSRPCP
jgi:cysteine-rich repeat protein